MHFNSRYFLSLTVGLLISFNAHALSTQDDSLRITVSDGTELFVNVRGDGIPCLYIHGGPGVGSYWMEKLYGNILEKHFTMVYLDQRGSGRSASAAGGDYSPLRMARDFEEIRKHLGIDSWITFSHSFGGPMQMEHALRYPETVRGMMLIESTLNLNESMEGMIKYSLDFLGINGKDRLPYLEEDKPPLDRLIPLFDMMREKKMFWTYHYGDPRNYHLMDSVMAEIPNPNKEFMRSALGMSQYYQNYKSMAANLDMPVLLYYGTNDYSIGPDHADDMPFPNKTIHKWKGGHVPFMEGKEELEETIAKWLKNEDL